VVSLLIRSRNQPGLPEIAGSFLNALENPFFNPERLETIPT